MASTERLSVSGRAYVFIVTVAGLVAAVHSLAALAAAPVRPSWFILAVLTLLSGSFTVRIPTIPARLSVSETFVFAAVLMFGPAAATVIVVLDTLVISFWLGRRANPPVRLLFNVAAPAVAIWVASQTFYLFTQIPPLSVTPQPIISLVFPLFGLAVLYFLLNSWLIAFAVAFQKRQSAFSLWRKNLLWLSLNYFSGASVAALLLPYLVQTGYAYIRVVGILLPILVISYLTLKTALGRVEDANRHLGELNKLYLSTIETLAMAIDAKDQITHGHIRRVQQYAIGLARHLGVSDGSLISAIEAASLLHDMGKLAIPEYILNKPGKLTVAEFDRMKAHASVGADILSAIDFPYPVVPIVRHHHENWDGSGYPDGLKGAEIPIRARVLSVVDCFDALTSDRPYRPRLPDSEAISILLQRRGTMYDPLVVDAFIEVYKQLTVSDPHSEDKVRHGLTAIARRTLQPQIVFPDTRFEDISSSTEEMVVLYDLAKLLSGLVEFDDAAETVAKQLRRIVPASTCVIYTYNPERDDVVARYATGEGSAYFIGLRISRGQRLTGWVAANLHTIVNSDPVLDLGDQARMMRPRLSSCLATPLIAENQLFGVLSLYAVARDAFTEDHKRVVEVVARQVSHTLKKLFELPRSIAATTDRPVASSSSQSFGSFLSSGVTPSTDANIAIILISWVLPLRTRSTHSSEGLTERLEKLVATIRIHLRETDVLFRYGNSEFVIVLTRTDVGATEAIRQRIAAGLIDNTSAIDADALGRAALGVAIAPRDGDTMDELVSSARDKQAPLMETISRPSIH